MTMALSTEHLFEFVKNRQQALIPIVPSAVWCHTKDRLASFKGAAGTILFFSETSTVKDLQQKFSTYFDKFPIWADQSLGMEQVIIWMALEAEGLGANLQHYNPLIDDQVAATWGIPSTWQLNAQMVFGGRNGEASEKEFISLKERVKVFGA
ncbi:hypothetical protein MRS44_009650 [Fusarium solani]|uniref:uncharacterized protein n=1 Tax=Fusarium solani TaxID=169388 RepID=UPI0032C467BA|nr:hypothetical protein MRS44_009650 [Fusarium solani]